ncbi:uncharacterized protein [Branchiostoma lanceolatum]|uniref:uncharacterized protein isoform X2 n=1 Tax=Branchiostoma lanceolatum TaxID=7740 RepID=UPI00345571D1
MRSFSVQGLIFLCELVLPAVVLATTLSFEVNSGDAEKGRTQLAEIRKRSGDPRYGKCWTTALARVESGCKRLTDDEQSRMAIAFANCHLAKSGRRDYQCKPGQTIQECTQDMDDLAFSTYTEFFTHTQNICFFLQNQVWQESTERTVSMLADNSDKVAQKLEVTAEMQEMVIARQNASLKKQEDILRHEEALRETLKSSTQNVQAAFDQMRQSAREQKALFGEVFGRIEDLQAMVLGEFTGFYTLVFITLSAIIIYMLTSTPRTSSARFWMFLILLLNAGMERLIANRTVLETDGPNATELVYERLWFCRKFFCMVAMTVLAVCSYRYKDYNKINNDLLLKIEQQNQQLQSALCKIQTSPLGMFAGGGDDMSDADDDTFHGSDDSDSDDGESRATSNSRRTSRAGTPVVNIATGLFTPIHADQADVATVKPEDFQTPDRPPSRNSEDSAIGSGPEPEPGPSSPSVRRRMGRPKGSRNYRESTPSIEDRVVSPGGRYNLRTRRTPQPNNPLTTQESPRSFARKVHTLARIARHNSHVLRMTHDDDDEPVGVAPKFFSSDEDD